MGMACWTVCEDCDEEAPELGDCGYLGYPSLDDKVANVDVATFGSIYRALAAVHVVTGEVDAFRRFLERHEGHRVVTETEDGSPFLDEDEMDDDEDLSADGDFDDDDAASDEDEFDEGDEDDETDDSTVIARYQATCTKCNASFITTESDSFVPFDRATLEDDDMKMYQRKVVSVMEDASYHAEPLYGGDLENLARFFKKHLKHEVVAELVLERD